MPDAGFDMAELVLSICIPTFNRAGKLGRLLEALAREMEGLSGQVEICISDNGSDDGTPDIIAQWEKRLPIVKNRNPRNMGFDINVVKAISLATGEFVWLMGDDDVPCEGAVGRLVENLKKHAGGKLGAVYLRTVPLNPKDLKKLDFGGFRVFSKSEEGCPHLPVGFIGSNCLHRSTAALIIEKKVKVGEQEIEKDCKDPHVLHGCVNTYLFLECILERGYFAVDAAPATRFMGDGTAVSANKKMLFDIWIYKQYYDIGVHYPWWHNSRLSDDMPVDFFLKYSFMRGLFASRISGVREAYWASQRLFARTMELEGNVAAAAMIRISGAAWRLPFFGDAAYLAYREYKKARREEDLLSHAAEIDPVMKTELDRAVSRIGDI